jgi:hypothetical protein
MRKETSIRLNWLVLILMILNITVFKDILIANILISLMLVVISANIVADFLNVRGNNN